MKNNNSKDNAALVPVTPVIVGANNPLALRGSSLMPAYQLAEMRQRRESLVLFIREQMTVGLDYGVIPGSSKPTLMKPGAERLCTFFNLVPEFIEVRCVEDFTAGRELFFYRYKCVLKRDDVAVGEGLGSCNTHEKKYRYRYAQRVCPECNQPCIRDAGADWDCAYYCHRKSGGCGARFEKGDDAIESQRVGLVDNPNVCDEVNTVDKMAQKRALIAATLIAVNASEFFTQDLDDLLPDRGPGPGPEPTPQGNGTTQPTPPDDGDQRPEAEKRKAVKPRGRAAAGKPATKPAAASTGSPTSTTPPQGDASLGQRDYTVNAVFVADVKRLARERVGLDDAAALGLLGSTAKGHGKASLNDCDNDWRNSFVASLEAGLFDHLKGKVIKGSELPQGDAPQGKAAEGPTNTPDKVERALTNAPPAPTPPAAAHAADDAGLASAASPQGVNGKPLDVSSWAAFVDLWNDAAIDNGWTPAEAAAVLHKRLVRVDRFGREHETKETWRLESILALRAQRIYKGSGAIVCPETPVEGMPSGPEPEAPALAGLDAQLVTTEKGPAPTPGPTKVTARRRRGAAAGA